jgi:hypothetical protein
VVVPLSLLPGLSRAVTSASGEGRGSRLPLPSPPLPFSPAASGRASLPPSRGVGGWVGRVREHATRSRALPAPRRDLAGPGLGRGTLGERVGVGVNGAGRASPDRPRGPAALRPREGWARSAGTDVPSRSLFFFPPPVREVDQQSRRTWPPLRSAPLRSALSSPGARGRPVASRHSASPPERTDAGSHRWRRSTSCPSVSPCGGLTSYPIAGSTSCLYREFLSVHSLLAV